MNTNQMVLNDFINKHPFDVAHILNQLTSEEVVGFFQSLSLDKNQKLLGLLSHKKAGECLLLMPQNRLLELIENSDASLIASILKYIDVSDRKKIFANISSNKQSLINRQLSFVPDSVATLIESAVTISKEMSIENALQLFKQTLIKNEFYLYVIGLEGDFKGIVRLKELFLSEPTSQLEDIIIRSIPTLLSDIPIKAVNEHFGWYEYSEMPVLDASGKFLGKLSHRNIRKFKNEARNSSFEIEETGNALGELFRIGLNGLLQGGGK